MAKAVTRDDDAAHVAERAKAAPERAARRKFMEVSKAPKKWSEMTKAERDDLVRIIGLRLGLIAPE
jgi:acyl-CoA reductase-like NAD-dependent aldehyde dehydrogenase